MRERILGRLAVYASSLGLYLPVAAGIITPMLWLLPAWYTAWYVVSYIFPFSDIWGGLWITWSDGLISSVLSVFLVFFQASAFLAGIILFLWALMTMVRERAKAKVIVESGPYARIRHPQHLGIILLVLSTSLINPIHSAAWSGIRPGDLLSWSLIAFLLIAISDWEETRLLGDIGEAYRVYQSKTAFMLMGLSWIPIHEVPSALERGKPLRYFAAFLVYWCFISIVLYVFTFVPLVWTR
ncbi:hypothetical protein EU538_00005 [Candidatus Thorarchaeota archaeon]|nr:MAG: hypothetical protein EU538_00005 [Candidatus Thorarchaeota archaeon]